MGRTLHADLDTHLNSPALTQIWFFELIAPLSTFRYCSQTDVLSFEGVTWDQANMTVSGPSVRAGAGMQASIEVDQEDALVASFLGESWVGATGRLHMSYYDGENIAPPVLLLSGDIDEVSLSRKKVSMTLTAGGNRASVTPWIRIAPPLFNHLTARGTVLTWGIDKIVIDRE